MALPARICRRLVTIAKLTILFALIIFALRRIYFLETHNELCGTVPTDWEQLKQDIEEGHRKADEIQDGKVGFKRALSLQKECKKLKDKAKTQSKDEMNVFYSSKPEVLFCPMCKVASTFWKRAIEMMKTNQGVDPHSYKTPFDIPIKEAVYKYNTFNIQTNMVKPNITVVQPFRFLFVRSPYTLLFSAYGDKLIKPTPEFFDMFGKPAIKRIRGDNKTTGSDVTFAEFVDEVVHVYRKSGRMDCHVATFGVCRPCSINYTFVGKLETFKQDTMDIFSLLGQQTTIDIFNQNFSALHANDAIDDVTQGVLLRRKRIEQYLKWSDAVKRIWRILQIRGIIDGARFPLTNEQVENISMEEFRQIIHGARLRSNREEMKRLKKLAFIEAYRTLPARLLDEIRDIFKEDFLMYEYEDRPSELYEKDRKIELHGFLNFSNIDEDVQPRGTFV